MVITAQTDLGPVKIYHCCAVKLQYYTLKLVKLLLVLLLRPSLWPLLSINPHKLISPFSLGQVQNLALRCVGSPKGVGVKTETPERGETGGE